MSVVTQLVQSRVAIMGMGLMGGSLALALSGRCKELLGIDPQPETVELALRSVLVNRASTQAEELLPEADIIILAAPVGTILELIRKLPTLHPGNAFVMDLGSTKVQICQALSDLPARFDPVGGHPMCGKETSGIANAEAGLFTGANFALTSLPESSPRAKSLAEEIVKAVGSIPFWLEADVHDRWTAATSHAPYLISIALTLAMELEAAGMIGPGFRSMSRLAGSSVEMMLDILTSNDKEVLSALHGVRQQLDALENALEMGDEATLKGLLTDGRVARQALLLPVEIEKS